MRSSINVFFKKNMKRIRGVAHINFDTKRSKTFENTYNSVLTFADLCTIYSCDDVTCNAVANILLEQCKKFSVKRYRGTPSDTIYAFQLSMARLGQPLPRDVKYLIIDMVYESEVDAAAAFEECALRFMRHGCNFFRLHRFSLDDVFKHLGVKNFQELYNGQGELATSARYVVGND
jgi:hypothetical protein